MINQTQIQTAVAETNREHLTAFMFGTDAAMLAYQLRSHSVNHTVSGISSPDVANAFAEDLKFAAETAGGYQNVQLLDGSDDENHKTVVRGLKDVLGNKSTDLIVITGLDTFLRTMRGVEDESHRSSFYAVSRMLGSTGVPQVCAVKTDSLPSEEAVSAVAATNDSLGLGRSGLFSRDYHFQGIVRPNDAASYLSEHMTIDNAYSTLREMRSSYSDHITFAALQGKIATLAAQA